MSQVHAAGVASAQSVGASLGGRGDQIQIKPPRSVLPSSELFPLSFAATAQHVASE
jgi:hypothetical protein